ncbi:MAG: response regulator transcription factor [Candidatus Sulfobium sp.]|jgi:two-component system response regulator NreC
MSKINVMIVDDHALVREGITALLRLYDDVQVVGEASDGSEAIANAEKLKPDVILMDIAMPGLGGLEATTEIKKRNPGIRVLVLSQYDDKEYVSRFLKANVSGYILKRAVGGELITAIRAVARGECYLHSSVASKVIDGYIGKTTEMPNPYDLLTDREKQVLKLVAEGNTHKEIASILGISIKTAVAHNTNICEKLGMHSKAELIKFAIQKGIIRLES